MTEEKHTPLDQVLPREMMDALKAVLCDPNGTVVISGSDEDRHIAQEALNAIDAHIERYLDTLVQDQNTIKALLDACERAQTRLLELGQNEACRTLKVLEAALALAKKA